MRTQEQINADVQDINTHICKEKALHAAGQVTAKSHASRMRTLMIYKRDLHDESTALKVAEWKQSNSDDYDQLMMF